MDQIERLREAKIRVSETCVQFSFRFYSFGNYCCNSHGGTLRSGRVSGRVIMRTVTFLRVLLVFLNVLSLSLMPRNTRNTIRKMTVRISDPTV